MSEYPWNEKNNTFTWLSSLYNLFKLCQLFFKSNFILAWRKQIFSCITFPQKSRIQFLPLILDLRQFVFPSFWWWSLHSLSFAKTTLAFLNFTVLSQQVLQYSCWYIPPGRFDTHLCVSTGRSLASPWPIPTDTVCGWSVPTISSALATLCFSRNCCISCKDIFLTRWLSRGWKYL